MVFVLDRYMNFSSIYPYHRVDFSIWNAPGHEYSAIEKLLLPFKQSVWIALFACSISTVLLTILLRPNLKQRKRNSLTWNVISLFLRGNSDWMPLRLSARIFVATLLFAIMVLHNSYQGSLFKFLQSQKKTQLLDTVEKLMQHNHHIYAPMTALFLLRFNLSSLPKK